MKNKKRNFIFYLEDMQTSMVRIADYTKDANYDGFH